MATKAVLVVVLVAALATASHAALKDMVTADGIFEHLHAFEDIANLPGNEGSRAVWLGYNDSVNYVVQMLTQHTNFNITIQPVDVVVSQYLETPELQAVWPLQTTFKLNDDFVGFNNGGSGEVVAAVQQVLGGCFIEDFADFVKGRIALLNRNSPAAQNQTCSYRDRVTNAIASGASGVLVYNPTDVLPTLGGASSGTPVPVFAINSATGNFFSEQLATGTVPRVRMAAKTLEAVHHTMNVLAETPFATHADRTIVVGAHLDSVPAGPGINDNGSGSATILEIALQLAKLSSPINSVRFAWWAAEEWGLLGSAHYVASLSDAEKSRIACNLNFDMLGSANYVRGVYDGRNGPTDVAVGSGNIQALFEEHFNTEGLTYEPSPFNGRSDYGPFIENGIPAGGLAAGAEETKTVEQRALFGGVAYAHLDTCYHRACDTVDNISRDAISELGAAAAYVTERLAYEPDLPAFLARN